MHPKWDAPGVSGSGDHGGLHYWPPQDTFYIRPLLTRAGNIADVPNTQKQKQRVRQKAEGNIFQRKIKTKPQKKNQAKWR